MATKSCDNNVLHESQQKQQKSIPYGGGFSRAKILGENFTTYKNEECFCFTHSYSSTLQSYPE